MAIAFLVAGIVFAVIGLGGVVTLASFKHGDSPRGKETLLLVFIFLALAGICFYNAWLRSR